MKRLIFLFAIVTSLVVGSLASASQVRSGRAEAGATRNGPVAKLIELERRKNEWLRQRFGR